ncbi:hypothetical protein NUU61_008140 [Penicillium alfredii]|uniref:Uncharacterized protein n=1 Tax=Penicillium alfredii TaxID=1506179 RepID=A0A9W9JYZ6_9EURO|nr:uncharacterized protein NUU61_008140 [Penicillium alfredii]KAJ5086833.1 hypothetical protein NUU61_008140 [Penicillium alfredii]
MCAGIRRGLGILEYRRQGTRHLHGDSFQIQALHTQRQALRDLIEPPIEPHRPVQLNQRQRSALVLLGLGREFQQLFHASHESVRLAVQLPLDLDPDEKRLHVMLESESRPDHVVVNRLTLAFILIQHPFERAIGGIISLGLRCAVDPERLASESPPARLRDFPFLVISDSTTAATEHIDLGCEMPGSFRDHRRWLARQLFGPIVIGNLENAAIATVDSRPHRYIGINVFSRHFIR